MVLYFITGNKNKFSEFKKQIPELEMLEVDLPEIQSSDAKEVIKQKILSALDQGKNNVIVEDTSLYLDCLNGLPGPLIRWFYESLGNEGIYNLTKNYSNHKATAKTIIGYAKNRDEIEFFEGDLEGEIVCPSGKTTFGWNPIFKPLNQEKTLQDMHPDEKSKISMRNKAINKLLEHLKENTP